MKMALTPKENYLRTLRGETPEYIPAGFLIPSIMPVFDELLTPNNLLETHGEPYVTSLGITYVATPELNYGAMPKPGSIVIDDITKWRDQLKIRDVTGRDWEGYYKKIQEKIDRENLGVAVDSGDYFLILVGLMGFENAMLAVVEEPEEVIELLTEVSKFLIMVAKQQMRYLKPDIYTVMDDDAAYHAPFFSLEIYRKIFKPFHKLHCDLALENGCMVLRHDCGRSEQFIEDWLELGICAWNPFQISNDCIGIKQKYGDRITLEGAWDGLKWGGVDYPDSELIEALEEYVDTYAPGGRFVFSAMAGPFGMDPNPKRDVVKKFYDEKVKYYYKTH